MKTISKFLILVCMIAFTATTVNSTPNAPTASPLAWQWANQLKQAGCVTLVGNPANFTVTVINCDCFEVPTAPTTIKLNYLKGQPTVTVNDPC